jgi:hypothetical protein
MSYKPPKAIAGNLVGAVIFVTAAYWFLYAQQEPEEPGDTPSGAPERTRDGAPVRA